MTQQSAVLLIAFLAGLVVAAVLLGTARRNVLPRSAMVIAALAIPIWVVYFASSQCRSLGLAVPGASLFEGEKHSAHTADARRVPVSGVSQLTIAQSEVKKVVITLHRTKRRTV